jgi:hypothetical protein
LYPERITEEEFGAKKASSVQAAADAVLDQHYENLSSSDTAASGSERANQRETDQPKSKGLALASRTSATDRSALGSDRKAYYLWVSETTAAQKSLLILGQMTLLSLLFGFMLQLILPGVWSSLSYGYETLLLRVAARVAEAA